MDQAELNVIARRTLDCAFRVHEQLGPGLLESSYKACLAYELMACGLSFQVEVPMPLVYKGQRLADVGYRLDLLIEGELVVELKSMDAVGPLQKAQLLSYLRLSDRRLGLLLNFNVPLLRQGIYRIVNQF